MRQTSKYFAGKIPPNLEEKKTEWRTILDLRIAPSKSGTGLVAMVTSRLEIEHKNTSLEL